MLDIHFAVKSNPFGPFLKAVEPFVDGFDIASIGELDQAVRPTMFPLLAQVNRKNEIYLAIKQGVKIIVESPHQLDVCQRRHRNLDCEHALWYALTIKSSAVVVALIKMVSE